MINAQKLTSDEISEVFFMKRFLFAALTVTLAFYWLSGCMKKSEAPENGKKPHLSDKLTLNDEGIPEITVYNIKEELSTRMDVESYVEGVLAGELLNNICMVGYALVMCIGINFLYNGDRKIKTVNMLPALLVPVGYEIIQKLIG